MTDTHQKLESLIADAAPSRLAAHRRKVCRQAEKDLAAHRFEAVMGALETAVKAGDEELATSIREAVDTHLAETIRRNSPEYRENLRYERRMGKQVEKSAIYIRLLALAGFVLNGVACWMQATPIWAGCIFAISWIMLIINAEDVALWFVERRQSKAETQ